MAQALVHKDYSILEQPRKTEYKILRKTVEKWLQPPGLQARIGGYLLPSYTCIDHVCDKGEVRGTWIDNREFAEMVALAWERAVERRVKGLGFSADDNVVGEWFEELRGAIAMAEGEKIERPNTAGSMLRKRGSGMLLVKERAPAGIKEEREAEELGDGERSSGDDDLYSK